MIHDTQDTMNDTVTENKLPVTPDGVEVFLASPWVEGIGPAYARKLVDRFGSDALSVLTNDPLKAEEIAGLGANRINIAAESIRNIKYPLESLIFLFSCGIGETYIEKIFGKYRKKAADIIATDPYSMVEEVWRLSFFTADKIGQALGIAKDDPRRLRGALLTAVKHYAEAGHLFALPEEAIGYTASITGAEPEKIMPEIDNLIKNGRLILSRGGIYIPVFYKAEKEGATKLSELASARISQHFPDDIPATDRMGHTYSAMQREAILAALNSPVMVLTGGPGSGKTTVLRGVIETLEKEGKKIILAAPTGRAAKRMTTMTGVVASTIHRLLGYRQGEGYHTRQIDADVLIIDEGSMMEQVLFNHLLQALRPGTRIILVGDVNQLPAIGAGDVLHDMIASGVVPVAHLNENFRQSEGSLIASGAREINSGIIPTSDPERDFMIIPEKSQKAIHDRIISLMTEELPEARGITPGEIVVVTPQQIGPLGARQLNIDLQQALNPEGPELKRGGTVMRLGDPVMQTANSSERGVYNGETGRIIAVDPQDQTLEVEFSDGRRSTYKRQELGELVLAYATTVHKLQGSEVKYMIFPITMAHKPMLYRNLLYTGVSRASRLCVLVGEEEAIKYAVENNPDKTRHSNFRHRLAESVLSLPCP